MEASTSWWSTNTRSSVFQEDIQEKFPRRLWARAMDSQRSIEKQKAECEAMAEEWIQEEMESPQWDVIPMVLVDGLYYYSTGEEAVPPGTGRRRGRLPHGGRLPDPHRGTTSPISGRGSPTGMGRRAPSRSR